MLSRWPIVADSVVRRPVFPPQERAGGSHEPRSALWVEVAAPGAHLHVINTHLGPLGTDSARVQEIEEVLRVAGDRVVPGGDLNSTPESKTQHRVRDAGWHDAWAECGGAGDGFSYPDGIPRKRIDCLGAGERCHGAQVIETHASDHRPLLVLLERQAGAPGGAIQPHWLHDPCPACWRSRWPSAARPSRSREQPR